MLEGNAYHAELSSNEQLRAMMLYIPLVRAGSNG
jgi:hypothetical protein